MALENSKIRLFGYRNKSRLSLRPIGRRGISFVRRASAETASFAPEPMPGKWITIKVEGCPAQVSIRAVRDVVERVGFWSEVQNLYARLQGVRRLLSLHAL